MDRDDQLEMAARKIVAAISEVSHSDIRNVTDIIAARTHRTEQQNVGRFAARFIESIAPKTYDLRNEATVRWARECLDQTADDCWSMPYI